MVLWFQSVKFDLIVSWKLGLVYVPFFCINEELQSVELVIKLKVKIIAYKTNRREVAIKRVYLDHEGKVGEHLTDTDIMC